MERVQFEQVVTEMEALNRRDPEGYRKKVGRFASLGFLVYAATLVFVLLLLALAVWIVVAGRIGGVSIKLLFAVGFLAFVFLRALWIKVEPPEGRIVTEAEAPELMRELERIRKQIGAPPIHQVLINEDYNAFAAAAPKFLVFGEQCYVVLGLRLMLTHPKEEVIAIVGHELAHHSRSHVRSGMREYRLEAMWRGVLYQLLEAGSVMVKPFLAFVKWYSPRFSAMSLVLRRQAEFEADELGAEATSKEAMAMGLVRLTVNGATVFAEQTKSIKEAVKRSEVPVAGVLQGLIDLSPPNPAKARDALVRGLRNETVFEDSHPSLRERTKAIGVSADPSKPEEVDALLAKLRPVDVSAAASFFGARLPALVREFDAKWIENAKEGWAEQHKQYEESRQTLQQFATRDIEEVSEKEAVDWVQSHGHYHGGENTVGLAIRAAERFPQNGELQFFAGYALVERDDEAGVAYLERALELNPRLQTAVHSSLAEFRAARGESHAAREASIAASQAEDAMIEKYNRLTEIRPGDAYSAGEVDAQERARLVGLFPQLKKVKAVYLVRRFDTTDPDTHVDLLVLIIARSAFMSEVDEYLATELQKAYKLFGTTKGVYATAILEKTPVANALAERPQMRLY
jgi:Zn-dependent protease with chaperone function